MQRAFCPMVFSLVLLLAVVSADGHEPEDCTSRLTVAANELRIEVFMGLDGVQQILPASGFSKPQITDIVRMRSAREPMNLPVTFATRLFELSADGNKLGAQAVTAFSDGLEVVFTLTYSRPATNALSVRATYFDSTTNVHPGGFVAYAEGGGRLGAVLLSRTNVSAQVVLPALKKNTKSAPISVADEKASAVRQDKAE